MIQTTSARRPQSSGTPARRRATMNPNRTNPIAHARPLPGSAKAPESRCLQKISAWKPMSRSAQEVAVQEATRATRAADGRQLGTCLDASTRGRVATGPKDTPADGQEQCPDAGAAVEPRSRNPWSRRHLPLCRTLGRLYLAAMMAVTSSLQDATPAVGAVPVPTKQAGASVVVLACRRTPHSGNVGAPTVSWAVRAQDVIGPAESGPTVRGCGLFGRRQRDPPVFVCDFCSMRPTVGVGRRRSTDGRESC
jgi:hypothetical protein